VVREGEIARKSCGKHGINPRKHPEKTEVSGSEKAKRRQTSLLDLLWKLICR
jgi:hypothetical protein